MRWLGDVCNRQKKYDAAEDFYKRSLAVRKADLAANPLAVAQVEDVLGQFYHRRDRSREAEQSFRRAIEILDSPAGAAADAQWLPTTLLSLGDLYEAQVGYGDTIDRYKFAKADAAYQRALTLIRGLVDGPAPGAAVKDLVKPLDKLARLYELHDLYGDDFNKDQFEKAVEMRQRIVSIQQKRVETEGMDSDDLVDALTSLGRLYGDNLRQEELAKREIYAKALAIYGVVAILQDEIDRNVEGTDSKDLVEPLQYLARLHEGQIKIRRERILSCRIALGRAVAIWQSASPIRSRALTPLISSNPRRLLRSFTRLRDHWVEAERAYKTVVEILDQRLAENAENVDGSDLIEPLTELATLYQAGGRFGEEEQILGRLVKLEGDRFDVKFDADLNVTPFVGLIHLYEMLGRRDEVRVLQRHLLDIQQKRLDAAAQTDSNARFSAMRSMADLLHSFHRYDEAEAAYKHALAIQEADKTETYPGSRTANLAALQSGLASLYEQLGRYGDAEAPRSRALSLREREIKRSPGGLAGLTLMRSVADLPGCTRYRALLRR